MVHIKRVNWNLAVGHCRYDSFEDIIEYPLSRFRWNDGWCRNGWSDFLSKLSYSNCVLIDFHMNDNKLGWLQIVTVLIVGTKLGKWD